MVIALVRIIETVLVSLRIILGRLLGKLGLGCLLAAPEELHGSKLHDDRRALAKSYLAGSRISQYSSTMYILYIACWGMNTPSCKGSCKI